MRLFLRHRLGTGTANKAPRGTVASIDVRRSRGVQSEGNLDGTGERVHVADVVQEDLDRPPGLELEGLVHGHGHDAVMQEGPDLHGKFVADKDDSAGSVVLRMAVATTARQPPVA